MIGLVNVYLSDPAPIALRLVVTLFNAALAGGATRTLGWICTVTSDHP
jgi:hypothetical protein